MSLGLYLHIPYCFSKCRYCDFYSAPGQRGVPRAYVDALLRELSRFAPDAPLRPDTLYFGGGTPSLLDPADAARLIDAAQPLPATSHTERRIVDRLVQLISARAGEKLSLQALADEAHISTTYLHRLFRSQLGISPGAYIAKIRIEESKLLLRGGALSMGEIAKKLGFSSQQHFSRQFRTVTGMTPSEYVRSLR